jgi:magnesium chelatase subunit D
MLADAVRRKGQSPLLILMTDGQANIGRDGAPGRAHALEDALAAGRKVRAAGVSAIAIDTSRPGPRQDMSPTQRLGEAMNARYLTLPYADAAHVSEIVRAATMSA